MVGNVPDAQDVYQEALLAAFQGLPRFRMDSVFSTWLYRIAVNKALRFRGRRQRRREIDEQSALETTRNRLPPRTARCWMHKATVTCGNFLCALLSPSPICLPPM